MVVPPVAEQRPFVVESPHGGRPDDYHWLRDDTRRDPRVLAHLAAENAYREAILAPLLTPDIARAIQQSPKVYFFDTALVKGDDGLRFENAVAAMLLKHVQFLADARGQATALHYLRTKDGAEVDFAIARDGALVQLVECKLSDERPHRALRRFAEQFPAAEAVQLVRDARQPQDLPPLLLRPAATWLQALSA